MMEGDDYLERRKYVVYRCYDAADRLLYIGCTENISARMAVHGSSWGNPVSAALNRRMTRRTDTEIIGKTAARAAERRAIYEEAPLLNQHHQKERCTPTERRRRIEEYLESTRPPVSPENAAALAELWAMTPA